MRLERVGGAADPLRMPGRPYRPVSGVLFLLCGAALLASGERDAFVPLGASLLLGLAIVWQAEAFAAMTGLRFGSVDVASPAPLVRLLGWLFFLAACAGCLRLWLG